VRGIPLAPFGSRYKVGEGLVFRNSGKRDSKMKCKYLILMTSMGFAAFLLGPSRALAQSAPTLGSATNFAILGASTVTCTAGGAVTGDVGVSPGTAITGFNPDCTLTGTLHPGDGVALQAHVDAGLAYLALAAQPCNFSFTGVTELAGLILPGETMSHPLNPGVYCFASSAKLNGTLNLQGAGPWIFRMGSTLITGATAPASVLVNGMANCDGKDVFWQVGSSATIGAGTQFVGNILAVASIGLDPTAELDGRALALNGAVTLSGSNTASVCGSGGSIPPPFPPGCRIKVICDCDDHHDKDGDHHDKDSDHHDKDGGICHDGDGDDHHGDDHHGDDGGKKGKHGR
jgi:Ice-binding-like